MAFFKKVKNLASGASSKKELKAPAHDRVLTAEGWKRRTQQPRKKAK